MDVQKLEGKRAVLVAHDLCKAFFRGLLNFRRDDDET